jgi:hypothetical protein
MKRTTVRHILLATLLTAIVSIPTVLTTVGAQSAAGGFPDLVAGLKATPGCLGVETARTASGKQVIFAWFENKKAALAWYYSDMHRAVAKGFFPNAPERTPMADIPDDGQPIMAIASLTPAPADGQTTMPFSQIAIELYRPLPGGLAVGGHFAPAAVSVPGLRDVPAAALAAQGKKIGG